MIGLAIAAAFSVWMLFQLPIPHDAPPVRTGSHQVFLGHNGVHIDFVFHRKQFFSLMPEPWQQWNQLSPDKPWLAVGWGDRDFLQNHPTWATVGLSDIMRAALASPASALRLSFTDLPWGYEKAELRLDDQTIGRLLQEIGASAAMDDAGKPQLIQHLQERDEALFVSPLRYSAFHTCNDWTAHILEAIGLPTPWVVTTSSSIMRYYETN